jgi:hypothetical protein
VIAQRVMTSRGRLRAPQRTAASNRAPCQEPSRSCTAAQAGASALIFQTEMSQPISRSVASGKSSRQLFC